MFHIARTFVRPSIVIFLMPDLYIPLRLGVKCENSMLFGVRLMFIVWVPA